jgi:hypothetical protein
MKTKLVYVLTSSPEKNYPEQALLSVFTARHYNPEAHIILIVDNVTDTIFVGKRAQILGLISEKIVVPIDESMTMMNKSRWIKTNVRNLVNGDFLFIDCDTIITQSLAEIDDCKYPVAAVPESHLPIKRFNRFLYEKVKELSTKIGWNINEEEFYFSSGVIYVKDIPENYKLYELWHTYWKEGCEIGISIDQPAFAKANIAMNRPVKILEGIWNCVMYTHVEFAYSSKILHFCSFRNMSYIFEDRFLSKVKQEGIIDNGFVVFSALNPYKTFIPFDNIIYTYKTKDFIRLFFDIRKISKLIYKNLESDYNDYLGKTRVEKNVKFLFHKKLFTTGALVLVSYKFYKVKLNKKYSYVSNTCASDNF